MQTGSVVQAGRVPVKLEEEFASDPRMQRLLLAAAQGQAGQVQAITAEGADINQPGDFYQLTPLMWAVMHGNADGVRLLLSLGADPNKRVPHVTEYEIDRRFEELRHEDPSLTHGRLASRLITFAGDSALSFALRKRRLDLMELLLQNGADPNIQGRIYPVMFNAVEVVHGEVSPALRLLIQYGADPNLTARPDGRGASAVDWFTFSGNMASAIYLIEQGADPARTVPRAMVGVDVTRETLTDENSVPWNQAAAVVQRFIGKNPDPQSRIYRLKKLMEQHGVEFPVYDPSRPMSPEQERSMNLLERLKYSGLPDHDIERTIEYHTRNNSLRDMGSLAEDYQRYREAKDGAQP